ncbi:MAG: hypothetical protein ACD_33C00002G0039 [uncultured bacterium]|nr:MAG: hypothetical protein ACD_33C00002G0039 [uncultured bacterium]
MSGTNYDELHEQHIKKTIVKNRTHNYMLKPEGYCHACGDDVEGVQLFCNNTCADIHKVNSKFR